MTTPAPEPTTHIHTGPVSLGSRRLLVMLGIFDRMLDEEKRQP